MGIYLFSNHVIFNTFLPVSGSVKSYWGLLLSRDFEGSLLYSINTLASYFQHIFKPFLIPYISLVNTSLIVVTILGSFKIYTSIRKSNFSTLENNSVPLIFIASIFVYFVTQLIYYSFLSAYIWRWYQGIGILLLYFLFIYSIFYSQSLKKNFQLTIYAITLIAFLIVDYKYSEQCVNSIENDETWGKVALRTSEWIDKNTNDDDIVGIWSAGQIGYYSNRRVMNLEGLVGNTALLEKTKEGTLISHVKQHGIKYIIQWFPSKLYNTSTGKFSPSNKPLLDLRTSLINDNLHEVKLIETIDIIGKRSKYSVFIFQLDNDD